MYTIESPVWKLCTVSKVIVLSAADTPPPLARLLALKNTSLNSDAKVADAVAPSPLPPVILIETISSMSKLTGSTSTSTKDPLTTGCTNAVVPVDTSGSLTTTEGAFAAS